MCHVVRALTIVILGVQLAGCQLAGASVEDRLRTDADAVRVALGVVDLRPPVSVVLVQSGKARDLYNGAYPSFVSEADGRDWQEKLDREAWRVDLVGTLSDPHPQCPEALIATATAQLILDRKSGAVLMSVYGQPPCPGT
jgi:hypothetical protein